MTINSKSSASCLLMNQPQYRFRFCVVEVQLKLSDRRIPSLKSRLSSKLYLESLISGNRRAFLISRTVTNLSFKVGTVAFFTKYCYLLVCLLSEKIHNKVQYEARSDLWKTVEYVIVFK